MALSYISTRGQSQPVTFSEAVLGGLARDGGLLVPESYPDFSARLTELAGLSYQQLAFEIFKPFVDGDIADADLQRLIENSYQTFDKAAVTPVSLGNNLALLELYHGPTLAFKDVALQFLGNLFEHLLQQNNQTLNILGATSGDTGSAAIYGVRGKANINIFMLHPKGKVSPVQERQMTTVLDDNVVNIAIEGDFDDGQGIVKTIFNELDFKDQYNLGAVNSINWARIMAQVTYYFYAAFQVLKAKPDCELVFAVPTGNFGDVFAGYVARQMGLPIKKLIVATNENDILARTLASGEYSVKGAVATISPSMDIQVSSNFERLLFDLCGRDGAQVSAYMQQLQQQGAFTLTDAQLAQATDLFAGVCIDQAQTLDCIRSIEQSEGWVIDPHTAVGIAAAQQQGDTYPICLATAHAAKFSAAVNQAVGHDPEVPASLEGIFDKEARCLTAPASSEAIKAIICDKLA